MMHKQIGLISYQKKKKQIGLIINGDKDNNQVG